MSSGNDDYKARVRATVFAHLAGIVVAPTVCALAKGGVLRLLSGDLGIEFGRLVELTHANRGYLRVALRLLVASGWLTYQPHDYRDSDRYALTEAGGMALSASPDLYSHALALAPPPAELERVVTGKDSRRSIDSLKEFSRRMRFRWLDLPGESATEMTVADQLRGHLDGLLAGPAMVAMGRTGFLGRLEQGPVELPRQEAAREALKPVLEAFETLGWMRLSPESVQLTVCGRYAAQIATSYGVTVSYWPALHQLDDLLFGDAAKSRTDADGVELYVDRAMNVWGSGGAHKTYFRKIDDIIIEIFDQPIDSQPRGICDMGSGDGAFLEHLYAVVRDKTRRGRVLDSNPLILVAADFNKVARRASRATLRRAGIPVFKVIHGDVNDPELLGRGMNQLGLDIREFLHVRSFLDHNRPYAAPADYQPGSRKPRSQGAFARLGDEIPAGELEENLVRHLRRWVPFVGRFGLLALELHTLPPALTAQYRDRTPAIAYDGTQGYSDQYLVELPVFLECAREAGLSADPRYQDAFPPTELATVSINLFRA